MRTQIRPHFFTTLKDTSSGKSFLQPMADAHSYTALALVCYLGPTSRSPTLFHTARFSLRRCQIPQIGAATLRPFLTKSTSPPYMLASRQKTRQYGSRVGAASPTRRAQMPARRLSSAAPYPRRIRPWSRRAIGRPRRRRRRPKRRPRGSS